eukprot:2066919-Prymnesium_polylepis.1
MHAGSSRLGSRAQWSGAALVIRAHARHMLRDEWEARGEGRRSDTAAGLRHIIARMPPAWADTPLHVDP